MAAWVWVFCAIHRRPAVTLTEPVVVPATWLALAAMAVFFAARLVAH